MQVQSLCSETPFFINVINMLLSSALTLSIQRASIYPYKRYRLSGKQQCKLCSQSLNTRNTLKLNLENCTCLFLANLA